jgi:hypothetical protein
VNATSRLFACTVSLTEGVDQPNSVTLVRLVVLVPSNCVYTEWIWSRYVEIFWAVVTLPWSMYRC